MEHLSFAPAEALLERLHTADREVVFLVGAPMTAPRPGSELGVPDARGMVALVQDYVRRNKSPRTAQALATALRTASNPYQVAFQQLAPVWSQGEANMLIRSAVLRSVHPTTRPTDGEATDPQRCEHLENHLDAWAYSPAVEALGNLAARRPEDFGRTILTTNFDPLIELSIRRAGGRAYSSTFARDGSLDVMRGQGSHVVHLHGYWHGTDTLHTPLSLGHDRPQLRASLQRVLRRRTVVVMAYGGWDDVFTRALEELCQDTGAQPDVLWCFYESDAERIRRDQSWLFDKLAGAIATHRVTFYSGIDCHAFLPELLRELIPGGATAGLSTPGAAPIRSEEHFVLRLGLQDKLREALERYQPVQLIGPRGVGKSALLSWWKDTLRAEGRRVAFINALGLNGRSPVELVLAASKALGQSEDVKRELYRDSAVPDTRAAERAIQRLTPLCLLVDEADARADAGHGFDQGFFDTLRALGQDKKLVWVSASQGDLFGLYRGTGLTSQFLNDAVKVHVGALSREEATHWFERRGVVPQDRVALGIELSGGAASALGWLAERLREPREAGETATIERDFRRWIDPLFRWWWKDLNASERGFLKCCLQE